MVPLSFVPAGQEDAKRLFPSLDHDATLVDLTVIGDGGEVFSGAKAWIICLWALHEYRSIAINLRSPASWWAAKRLVTVVSRNRHRLAVSGGGH